MMPKLPLSKVKKLCLEESENHQLYRSKERKSQLGEVFTPTKLVLQMLTKLPKGTKKGAWTEGKTYCDPACGNG